LLVLFSYLCCPNFILCIASEALISNCIQSIGIGACFQMLQNQWQECNRQVTEVVTVFLRLLKNVKFFSPFVETENKV
jgi:hypothetical protein